MYYERGAISECRHRRIILYPVLFLVVVCRGFLYASAGYLHAKVFRGVHRSKNTETLGVRVAELDKR